MSKFKNNQCPECGNTEFEQMEKHFRTYVFTKHGFDDEMGTSEFISSLPGMECSDCEAKIDEFESEKQGKIVLDTS